jgi:hypothetical protein
MGILFLLVFALAGRSAETVAAEQGAGFVAGENCPPAHAQSETRVRNLLSSPLLPEMAARFNIGTASASDVRLLTNRGDLETCRALWNALASSGTELSAEDRVTFYRSGDTFFVPISRSRRPGTPAAIHLDGYSSLDVYDAEFRLVGRFGA